MTSQTLSLAHSAYSCGTTRRRSQPAGKRGSLAATVVAAVAVHALLFAALAPVVVAVAVGVAVGGVALAA
jgi:hypothetical protein